MARLCSTCGDRRFLAGGTSACPDCARIAILGAPNTGKTTLAAQLDVAALHTDDVAGLGWSESSAAAALWFDLAGPFVIEGVAVARALRKWLGTHALDDTRPCDLLIVLEGEPFVTPLVGQASMGKAIATVLAGIEPALVARGVRIVRLDLNTVERQAVAS